MKVEVDYLGRNEVAIRVRQWIGEEWVPVEEIVNLNDIEDQLVAGAEIEIDIPRWLAERKGFA